MWSPAQVKNGLGFYNLPLQNFCLIFTLSLLLPIAYFSHLLVFSLVFSFLIKITKSRHIFYMSTFIFLLQAQCCEAVMYFRIFEFTPLMVNILDFSRNMSHFDKQKWHQYYPFLFFAIFQ